LNWSIGRNSILCDEMGLGKTVQCCTLINHLITRENVRGPVLVVAPLSTLAFWRREIERFTELYAIIYRGTKQARRVIRSFDWLWPTDMTTSSSKPASRRSKA
jgi:SNF2 family DNA or RNA helicase